MLSPNVPHLNFLACLREPLTDPPPWQSHSVGKQHLYVRLPSIILMYIDSLNLI